MACTAGLTGWGTDIIGVGFGAEVGPAEEGAVGRITGAGFGAEVGAAEEGAGGWIAGAGAAGVVGAVCVKPSLSRIELKKLIGYSFL